MSKLDRQLDDFSGGGRVEIHVAAGEEIDVGQLHQMLRNEIDSRPHRIPLDLRGVHGAPEPLINVLIESQRYARSQGKLLSISYALPPMKDALNPHRRRKAGKSDEAIDEGAADAGEVAKTLIDSRLSEESTYDLSKAEKIRRDKKKKKKRSKQKPSRTRNYLALGGLILLGAAVIGAVEYIIIFSDQPDTVLMPEKSFERKQPSASDGP